MQDFVAPPPKPLAPQITLQQLGDALALFLPTVCNYQHAWWDFEPDRSDKSTMLFFNGQMDPELGRRVQLISRLH